MSTATADPATPLRVLLVEDSPDDAALIARELKRQNVPVQWERVEDPAGLAQALGSGVWDAVLSDFNLPGFNGLDALRMVRGRHPGLPFILVSGAVGEDTAVEALKAGANDFLLKDRLGRLGPAIERALEEGRLHQEHRRDLEALKASEARYALAAMGVNDGLWDWDLVTDRLYLSPRWRGLVGLPETESVGSPDEWFKRIHPEDKFWLLEKVSSHQSRDANHFDHECRMRHEDGTDRWMLFRGLAVWDATGKAIRMAGSMTDITQKRAAAEALQRSALYDPLTGLPKPVLFLDRLKGAVERAQRAGSAPPAVICLNLDRFRTLNEGLGSQTGNELLVALAKRLEHCAGPGDTAARLAGDDFALLLEGLVSPAEAVNAAERVMGVLAAPYQVKEMEVHITASLGVAWLEAPDNPALLLENARDALFRAKTMGRDQFQVFTPDMHRDSHQRVRMETDLHRALDRSEFELFYQPIFSLKKGRINGFEALVRWRHPDRGLVPPLDFIPLTEATGLILPLGQWILEEGCRQLGKWSQITAGKNPLTMSINLSGRQMIQPGWADRLMETISLQKVSPRQVSLEITESEAMRDPDSVLGDLKKIRAFGCRISLDDFGTGYSSLSRLHRFPLDCLKVDRSFVSNMDQDAERAEIVRTILLLAGNLKLEVVAEGIETKGELDLLRKMGCSQGQGYLFSKPLPAADAEAFLLRDPSW